MNEMVLPFVGISFNIKIGDALNILSWPYNQAHCVYPAMFKAAITQLSPEIRSNAALVGIPAVFNYEAPELEPLTDEEKNNTLTDDEYVAESLEWNRHICEEMQINLNHFHANGNVDLIRYVESLRYLYMLPETRRDVV